MPLSVLLPLLAVRSFRKYSDEGIFVRSVRAGVRERRDIMSGGRSARKKPAAIIHHRVAPDYPKEEQDKLTLLRSLEKMGCNGLLAAP